MKGDLKKDQTGQTIVGNTRNFTGYSSNLVNTVGGYYTVSDGRVPAYWDLFETTGPCQRDQLVYNGLLTSQQTQDMYCVIPDNFSQFNVNPGTVDGSAPVGQLDLNNGSNIDQTNGTPQVVIYDALGNSYYTGDAINVSAGAATAQNIPAGIMLTGSYAVVVKNRNSDGSFSSIGGAQLAVTNNDPSGGDPCSDFCLCSPCTNSIRRPY